MARSATSSMKEVETRWKKMRNDVLFIVPGRFFLFHFSLFHFSFLYFLGEQYKGNICIASSFLFSVSTV